MPTAAACGALDAELEARGIPLLGGMHCYDVFGRDEVREAMEHEPGTYFLTDFLVRSFDRTVWRVARSRPPP